MIDSLSYQNTEYALALRIELIMYGYKDNWGILRETVLPFGLLTLI